MKITNKKLARAALLGAAIAAGIDLTPTNQAVAQVYVPTNLYKYEECTIHYYPNYSILPVIKNGGKCTGTGGNCLSSANCS